MQTRRSHVLISALLLAAINVSATVAMAQSGMSPEMRAKAQAMAQNCKEDIKKVCDGIRPGGGRILICLRNNSERLSQPCRDAVPKARSQPSSKPAQSGTSQ